MLPRRLHQLSTLCANLVAIRIVRLFWGQTSYEAVTSPESPLERGTSGNFCTLDFIFTGGNVHW